MEPKIARRTLTFSDFDQVIAELDRLLAHGYDRAGNWTLAQNADHLRMWMSYLIDGYPRAPVLMRPLLFVARNTFGPAILRNVVKTRHMPSGARSPFSIPASEGGDSRSVDAFKETIRRFESHAGPIHPSPMFGRMTREQARSLQLVHCAHHIGFLIPKSR